MSITNDENDVNSRIKSCKYGEIVTLSINNNTDDIILVPTIDKSNGGILFQQDIQYTPLERHFRTKKWIFPMLNDTHRNNVYESSLRDALRDISKQRITTAITNLRILDVGSGTGLLSLFAARYAKQFSVDDDAVITSLEMSQPMCEVARKVVEMNGMSDKITVLNESSMGFECFRKYDLMVCELLESGCLGEGLVPTVRDARRRLLTEDAVIIPNKVTVYAMILELEDDSCCLEGYYYHDDASAGCSMDVKAKNILEESGVRKLSTQIMAMDIDLMGDLPSGEEKSITWKATASGTACGVLFWWEIGLYGNHKYNTLGTEMNQDHWQQRLYLLKKPIDNIVKGEDYQLTATRDDYSITFEVNHDYHQSSCKKIKTNDEGIVTTHNNSSSRNKNINSPLMITRRGIQAALQRFPSGSEVNILDISDQGHGAIVASELSSSSAAAALSCTITSLQSDPITLPTSPLTTITSSVQYLATHPEHLQTKDLYDKPIDIIILGGPYHNKTLLHWELPQLLNLSCTIRGFQRRAAAGLLSPSVIVVPSNARVMACAIQCDLLRDAYGPLVPDRTGGFDHEFVNDNGCRQFHKYDFVFPLMRDYDYEALTDNFCLFDIDFLQNDNSKNNNSSSSSSGDNNDSVVGTTAVVDNNVIVQKRSVAPFQKDGVCHAMMIWVEYYNLSGDDEGSSSSSFKEEKSDENKSITTTLTKWHWQSVRFLETNEHVKRGDLFTCDSSFGLMDGIEDYNFSLMIQKKDDEP